MILFRRIALLLAGAVVFGAFAGLTVKKTSVEELTSTSQLIVQARVGTAFAQWENKNIYTYTQLQVIESIKGSAPEKVTVKQLGGRVGQDALDVPGTPKLNEGDEVVLFLVRWNDAYWVHSIVLGKFSVERSEGRVEAINDLNNVGLIDPVTGQEITDAASKRNAMPLDALKREIRSYITN